MPLYRPSELREFLHSIDKNPLRFSSQRFLIDGNVVAKILALVGHKNVIEIGPGPGVLTEELLSKGHAVVAIEKDTDFAERLTRLSPLLVVKNEDVLRCSLEEICRTFFPEGEVTVVSNLPYHLTTPIIEWLIASKHLFSKAVLMVQKEAALRLTAKKGGLLPLFLAYCGRIEMECTVSKNCFWPKPHVDSAVITFEPTHGKDQSQEVKFFDFLRLLFSQKRKTIFHQLKNMIGKEKALDLLEKAGISPQARPEEMALDTIFQLFTSL